MRLLRDLTAALQNLHPRFKSGRRLHFSKEVSVVCERMHIALTAALTISAAGRGLDDACDQLRTLGSNLDRAPRRPFIQARNTIDCCSSRVALKAPKIR